MVRSTVITPVFIPGSAARRRFNQFIDNQIAQINGNYDSDLTTAGVIEGAIRFAAACGLFGVTSATTHAAVRQLRKELNARLDLKFKDSRGVTHVCLSEE